MIHQLPYQLLATLEHVKGFNKPSFQAVHLSGDRVTSVRINPDKIKSADVLHYPKSPVPWCSNGYYLMERPLFTFNPLIHAGGFYVQEASSMFLEHIIKSLSLDKKAKVLDLCAAPGGKSTLLSSYFKNGVVVCNEVIQSRAAILVENMVKWGNDNTIVTNNDPRQFAECKELFDVIVLDAPCSGSGLFRKDNAAIGEWSPESVQHCSLRQQRILQDILPCLKNDGILIYATCSYSIAEDEDNADFIINHDKSIVSVQIPFDKEWNIVETISDNTNSFGYRFFPDKVKGEGFFVAVFKKSSNDDSNYDIQIKVDKNTIVSKTEKEVIQNFINIPEQYEYWKYRDAILALPVENIDFIRLIVSKLYIKRVGIELGNVKGKDFIPSHHLAMSSKLSELYTQKIELDEETALKYLRKQELNINSSKGWNLIQFKNLPLGWIKGLTNRINNYYPAEWRIMKS